MSLIGEIKGKTIIPDAAPESFGVKQKLLR